MAKVFKNPISEEYAKKWHPTLNGDLTPADYSAGSKVKVHWLCEKTGHSYFKSIQDVTKGSGCSVCAGFQVSIGFNDLDSKFPEIAKEWHPTLNGDDKSIDFTYGSHYNAFWLGECGHEFQATINRRVSLGNGCPYCAGQKILIGFNDLPTTHPEIIKQWDYEKNELSPEHYTAGTNTKVYWVGTCGHSFLNAVSEKIRSAETDADGCPYCAGKKILKGFNDLDSQYPAIAKEWSPNNKKRADEVSFKAVTSSLWICPEGHEYKTGIRQRTLKGTGCLYCTGRRVMAGENDFSARFPTLAQEGDEEKNGDLSKHGMSSTSPVSVWWKCSARSFSSSAEKEILNLLIGLGESVLSNDRSLLRKSEVDIYLPERKVAIEFNGLYWHSLGMNGKTKSYHYDKYKKCQELGVQLFQIWEDDWKHRKNIVIKSLLNKLSIVDESLIHSLLPDLELREKEYGRKTTVANISLAEAKGFLNENHIQGFASGTHYLALKNRSMETVACMVLKKKNSGEFEISRYATDRNVVGGFTKVLKYAERHLGIEKIVTFSDNCISDGALYQNNGFIQDKILAPDYKYVVKGKREHKFGYRISKFKQDASLLYEEGMTERELAELNNLKRIYDAGKIRWTKG